jgi:hypothetical protein
VVLLTACSRGREPTTLPPLDDPAALAPRPVPNDAEPSRVSWIDLVPEQFTRIPRWNEEQFGEPMPASTWRPEDQHGTPFRWDAADLEPDGRGRPGSQRFTVYHGHGCCGGCQAVALLGAVLSQHRIDAGSPVPANRSVPHRADLPAGLDELDIRPILATSRHAYIMGGRDIPDVAPALAVVGAPYKDDLRPLLEHAGDPWTPARFCQAVMGHDLPVFRARVREHDVRFMTVALRQGPVVISGAFNRLVRGEDGVYRCPADARDMGRHHFMLVVGWEAYDRDRDGRADEVVWLVRDDNERRGGDTDAWNDAFLDDEWGRLVPRGCLLDEGRAHSVIPGSATIGSFDDALLAGPDGRRVSYCEYDPDQDGVATARDLCPFTPGPEQLDRDGDGIGDACDPCPDAVPVRGPTRGHRDEDHDGLANECDPCPEDANRECRP